MVGVSSSPFSPFPTDVMKSAVDICEFWLSFEKSELFDIPSLSSNFIVVNRNTRAPIQTRARRPTLIKSTKQLAENESRAGGTVNNHLQCYRARGALYQHRKHVFCPKNQRLVTHTWKSFPRTTDCDVTTKNI